MSLGNLVFGGGSNSSGSGVTKGIPSAKSDGHRVIRNEFFKDRDLKNRIRNSAPVKAWHKIRVKKNGKMVTGVVRDVIAKNKVIHTYRNNGERTVVKDYDDNILKVVQGSVKRGQTVSSWKNNIIKNRRLESTEKGKNKIVYHIGGNEANREKREDLVEIFDPQGPTKEEIIAEEKKQERFRRRNVSINRERTEAEKIKEARSNSKQYQEKSKHNSTDLGIQGEKYKTSIGSTVVSEDDFKGVKAPSALGAGYVGQDKSADPFSQGEGAASVAGGIGSKPQEESGENVVEGNFPKEQDPFDNNIMPRTGTNG